MSATTSYARAAPPRGGHQGQYSHPVSPQYHAEQQPQQPQHKQYAPTHSYYFSSQSSRGSKPGAGPPSSSSASTSKDVSRPLPEDVWGYATQSQTQPFHNPSSQSYSSASQPHRASSSTTYPAKRGYAPSSAPHSHRPHRYEAYHDSLPSPPPRHQPQHHHRPHENIALMQSQSQQQHAVVDDIYYRQEVNRPGRTSTASSISSSPSFASFSPASSVSSSSSTPPSPKSPPLALASASDSPSFPMGRLTVVSANRGQEVSDYEEKALRMPLDASGSTPACPRPSPWSPSLSSSMDMDDGMTSSRSHSPTFSAMHIDTAPEVTASLHPISPSPCAAPDCDDAFAGQQGLKRHAPDHQKSDAGEWRPCTLPNCQVSLRTKQSLRAHERLCRQRVAGQLHPCPETGCSATYSSTENLSRHRLKHTRGLIGIKYPCTWADCDKILATPKSLKDHLQIHAERDAGIQLFCPVPGCNKVFGTNRCLRAHELRCKQVKSGTRLPCPVPDCTMTFGSTDYVRRHVLDHEKGLIGMEFRCDYADCRAVLANPLTLQRHKQLHEEQSLGFDWTCLVEDCGKVYSGSKQLTDHQSRIHKNLGPEHRFSCPYKQCEEKFECQRSAYKHSCLYEKKQCPFEGCPCLLPNTEALDSHVWMHNTLTTRPPYPCFEENCSKVFDTKAGILAHALTHIVTDR